MSQKKKPKKMPPQTDIDPRMNPETRLTPMFDAVSIKEFDAPERDVMGVRVLDNAAEEHSM